MDFSLYIMPELLILVPVLMVMGRFLKDSSISNEKIPITLGISGVVMASLWVIANTQPLMPADMAMALFTAIIQGVLCAAAAVYGHQLYKQG